MAVFFVVSMLVACLQSCANLSRRQINTGSVVLARLVRRHVHHQLAASASSAAGLPTAPAPSTTHIALPFHPSPSRAHLAPNRLSSVMSNRSDVEQGRDLEKMSQREMKEIAGKTHTVEGVLAARVLQLLKAERALVVTASCLVAISVCATV